MRSNEENAARAVFHKINGNLTLDEKGESLITFRSYEYRQSLFETRGCLCTDLNVADYALAERAHTRFFYNDDNHRFTSIIAATEPLIRHTRDYYERLRSELRLTAKPTRSTKQNTN